MSDNQGLAPQTPNTSRPGPSAGNPPSSAVFLQPPLPNGSSPEMSRSPLTNPSLQFSQSATPYSWPPTQQPGSIWNLPPAPLGFIYDATGQLIPYNPPPVNPWSIRNSSEENESRRKRKSTASAKQTGGGSKKKRATSSGTQAGGESEPGSQRAYARWDGKNDEGLTTEACLVQWMGGGGWRSWKNAKSTGEKDKCCRSINAHLVEHGHSERSKDSIMAKFKTLEDSYKKALLWEHSTGSGVSKDIGEEDDDGRSPFQRELEKRCKHYVGMQLAFGDRASIMPRRVYSSVESEAMLQADHDIRCLLGLERFEGEEGDDDGVNEEGNGQGPEDQQKPADESSASGSRAQQERAQSISQASQASGTRSRRGSLFKNDVIKSYLTGKKQTEKMRLQVETRRLDREDREEERLERKMLLEEHRFAQDQQRQRAEIIATYIKAGLSLADATKAYEDGKAESAQAAASISQEFQSAQKALRTSRGGSGTAAGGRKGKGRAESLDEIEISSSDDELVDDEEENM